MKARKLSVHAPSVFLIAIGFGLESLYAVARGSGNCQPNIWH